MHRQRGTIRILFWLVPLALLFALWSLLGIWTDVKSPEGILVPEGFSVEEAVLPGLVKYPMFAVFDDQGKLFVFESSGSTENTEAILENPAFKILLLEDTDDDGVFDHKTVYADQLPFPMGGVYINGSLIVTAAPDVLKLTDTNGDGRADQREVLLSGWKLNHNAAILSGPFLAPDGWLYFADARRGFDILSREGVKFSGKGARIWRCLPDGTQLQSFAGGGFDNAVELAFTPSGEVLGTMTYFIDPQGGYRDALIHWVWGGVYPKPHTVIKEDKLIRTGKLMPVMHRMARVSPSGLMRYEGNSWGDAFEGNLFHAEFNTGRIIRTKLLPSGASFNTQSDYFLTAELSDFHPTDVLQEADGHLLVVNTGGWFIAGCPLSRTAKPEVPGSIYRIKNANSGWKDPWGKNVEWENLGIPQIIALLSDKRPKVSNKAGELLLREPLQAIPYLTEILQNHEDERVRAKAVFLLFRSHSPRAWHRMQMGLEDNSSLVRAATARALGNAVVYTAVDGLINALEDESMAVGLQAATALGQIGDPKATEPLLAALKGNTYDRYFEHAVIYALIHLENEAILKSKLEDPQLTKAILITLDQKGGDILDKVTLAPYLYAEDAALYQSAVWVLGNHPAWHDLFLDRFKHDLNNGNELEESEIAGLFSIFKENAEVQEAIAEALKSPNREVDKKKAVIDLIGEYPTETFPESYKNAFTGLLKEQGSGLQHDILDLALKLNLRDFDSALQQLMADSNPDLLIRQKALLLKTAGNEKISNADFDFLLEVLTQSQIFTTETMAIRVLNQAALNTEMLRDLLRQVIPQIQVGHISSILDLYKKMNDADLAKELEFQLLQLDTLWDNLSLDQVERLFAAFPGTGEIIVDSLSSRHAARLESLEIKESQLLSGDVERGRELFFGKAACGTCHAVSERGDTFGPDLTNIGEIRLQHDILEAIIFPSASFAREYETSLIITKSGDITGIIEGLNEGFYEVKIGPGLITKIPENQVVSITSTDRSMMPSGLETSMSDQELSDLMAYLISLPEGLYRDFNNSVK